MQYWIKVLNWLGFLYSRASCTFLVFLKTYPNTSLIFGWIYLWYCSPNLHKKCNPIKKISIHIWSIEIYSIDYKCTGIYHCKLKDYRPSKTVRNQDEDILCIRVSYVSSRHSQKCVTLLKLHAELKTNFSLLLLETLWSQIAISEVSKYRAILTFCSWAQWPHKHFCRNLKTES